MIPGVEVRPLVKHVDERGYIMEMLRDSTCFEGFKQTYVCVVNPGAVKAWHKHRKQTDHFVCVSGMAKVVLFDAGTAEINEFFIGDDNPVLLRIPAGIWHGMKGISTEPAIIVNHPTQEYNAADPDEIRRPVENSPSTWSIASIPYNWDRKDC